MTRAPFLQAANYDRGRRGARIRVICLHDEEAPEQAQIAAAVARYFHNEARDPATGSSAHSVVDDAETWRCVKDSDMAWAAPGANLIGLHLEQAGYARQTRAQWLDPYSRHVINRAAAQAAAWCIRHDLRPLFLTDSELADIAAGLSDATGVTTHLQVTRVLNNGQGHLDPGEHYPHDVFIDDLHAELASSRRGRRLLHRWQIG